MLTTLLLLSPLSPSSLFDHLLHVHIFFYDHQTIHSNLVPPICLYYTIQFNSILIMYDPSPRDECQHHT